MIRCLVVIICVLSISACSSFGGGKNRTLTLSDLPKAYLPEEPMPVEKTSIDIIEDHYRSALEIAVDPGVRHRVLIRLADLELVRSQEKQLDTTEQQAYYEDSIAMFQELLVLNAARQGEPDTPTNERLLYQLSKAYALDGRMEESNQVLAQLIEQFPDSQFAAEVEFRRGELAFSNRDYKAAEDLYGQVMLEGDGTPFYDNAVYMHGWSQFKRGRYRASLKSFTEVLDRVLIEGKSFDDLRNSQKNMVNDTLRVLSLAFSYIDGAETITEIYQKWGQRHYQHMLYMNLGDLYLEKKRYRDSADTYRHYVKHFPETDWAPQFSEKAIKVYIAGDFPSLVLPAKEEFVRNYGFYSEFWRVRDEVAQNKLRPQLHTYIDELASYYHAQGIALKEAGEVFNKNPKAKNKDKPEPYEPQFVKAADLYQEFIHTFPQDSKTPEFAYLMGEAHFEARNYPKAVEAYEMVAYQYLDKKRGPDAGYNALVTMQILIDQTQAPELLEQNQIWKNKKIDSAISYADYYPTDKRAAPVLTKAAQEIFESGNYMRSIEVATRIVEWQPPVEKSLQKTAWLVIAHSQFDMAQYAEAEWAYRQLLSLLPANDQERHQVIERIAACMYRIAEFQVAEGNLAGAVDKLLGIREIAPASDIAISAQYDAANHLMTLKDWNAAEQVILDFRRRYPTHELVKTLPPKLAVIYQESEQWGKAANVLADMSKNDSDPDVRRQSLYLSAELYEKIGKKDEAITHYKQYANTYPLPFAIATEARFHLVELYEQTNQDGKRDFWLKKLISEHAAAGGNATDRSKYLAAFASAKFAKDEYLAFERIKLSLPIKKSLNRKKAALDKTLKAYRKVLAYGVAEFATEANYRIGMVYAQLSKDLMNSQRPKGLDVLALEQYEILLEEQAYPFEEKAIDIHAANSERAWKGIYDNWVKESFETLAKLLPARYGKKEKRLEVSDGIY
ncbi:tetratricopeptide repeat protein [Teredinibacter sp. KSP-S5-2]|uniref:tetratricopeptide repeat protein n=1 Tax=Teredinibacter sp. KSP-S5-2 TaxID=3034506 RepID=UPI002935205B|nr:tetratricopeptide repeat protein [Teredinibacter sp. KSP-S5-2]WNO08967.1 tetratricopeptide repeat protein [Teredinibacter sp. KSP-S5-2]